MLSVWLRFRQRNEDANMVSERPLSLRKVASERAVKGRLDAS